MIQITAVKFKNGTSHKDIAMFKWHELGKPITTKESNLETMVKFTESRPGKVVVRHGNQAVLVKVIEGANSKYLQCYEEKGLCNTLIELPEF